jgi:hypothetical protein
MMPIDPANKKSVICTGIWLALFAFFHQVFIDRHTAEKGAKCLVLSDFWPAII